MAVMSFKDNVETKAILTIGKALDTLTPEAQVRVIVDYFAGLVRERHAGGGLAIGDFEDEATGTVLHGTPKNGERHE